MARRSFANARPATRVGEGAKPKTGPVLNGVIGRTAGTTEGFKYSKAMIGAGEEGLVWTVEKLDEYLTNPRQFVKGNRMSFAGLKRDKDRADVIAYLATFQ